MSVFKRGGVWWYEFQFQGIRIRESAHTGQKEIANRAERERRRKLELSGNALEEVARPKLFSLAAKDWLKGQPHWSDNTRRIERTNLSHVLPHLGKLLLSDLKPVHVERYQSARLREHAAPKTINLEVGTIRQILRSHQMWGPFDNRVRMLRVDDEIGRSLTEDELRRIFAAAQKTRSRALPFALGLYFFTGLRLSELRLMRWRQVDWMEAFVVTGRGRGGDAKTKGGSGRRVDLAPTALKLLAAWRAKFPEAQEAHYIFPSERYGLDGERGHKDGNVTVYAINPDKPVSSWKTAWTTCRSIAKVQCRTHDLRHTFVSTIAEHPDVSDSTLMALAGHVSKKMLSHYTHASTAARRRAVAVLEERGAAAMTPARSPQKSPQ